MKVDTTILLILLALSSCTNLSPINKVADLKTEYFSEPIGLDTQTPRFTWLLKSNLDSILQTSYHVYVGTDSVAVAGRKGNMWDEEKNRDLTYQGTPLKPFTKYYWSIEVSDNKGNQSNLAVSSFETGMIKTSNWRGLWKNKEQPSDQSALHSVKEPPNKCC